MRTLCIDFYLNGKRVLSVTSEVGTPSQKMAVFAIVSVTRRLAWMDTHFLGMDHCVSKITQFRYMRYASVVLEGIPRLTKVVGGKVFLRKTCGSG